MTDTNRTIEPRDSAAPGRHVAREVLSEYATETALGNAPQEIYPTVAEHLADCETCRADLSDLLELTIPAYDGEVEAADSYPPADLSFLCPPVPAPIERTNPWRIDAAGRLVIEFTEALLNSLRTPSLAGASRSQLLYRYVQDPGSVQDLDVTIEAFAEDLATGVGRVRVGVDVPSRGPFDQGGSRVELRTSDQTWHDETDDTGSVDFTPIPLAALPRLRVAISPPQ